MFNEILRNLREEKGFSQKCVAEHLNISRQAYNHYESGKREPSYDVLKKLADYFGVTTDYLLGNSDTKILKDSELTEKDKKDISKKLTSLLDELDNQEALMFDGEALDEETKELLRNSLKNSLETGKLIAKQKFTPKKYRK